MLLTLYCLHDAVCTMVVIMRLEFLFWSSFWSKFRSPFLLLSTFWALSLLHHFRTWPLMMLEAILCHSLKHLIQTEINAERLICISVNSHAMVWYFESQIWWRNIRNLEYSEVGMQCKYKSCALWYQLWQECQAWGYCLVLFERLAITCSWWGKSLVCLHGRTQYSNKRTSGPYMSIASRPANWV